METKHPFVAIILDALLLALKLALYNFLCFISFCSMKTGLAFKEKEHSFLHKGYFAFIM
jgi:hypothetical protein